MKEYICYCFKYTEEDIINDLKANGSSTIYERIVAAKRLNQCNCAVNHPEKR
ncbi:MAG: hypothetical protein GYA16_11180 [Spirochaetes bacterium]|nr:hypothetical protein [Spirochaetota bacterium]NMB65416.1 hypothetical protein [Spirochaetota bacterium]